MPLWGIRSGKYGERESLALLNDLAVVGWDELPDLRGLGSREDLKALLESTYPDMKAKALSNWESQIWPFVRVMEVGDPIVMPLKHRSGFAMGRVRGPYAYERHGVEFLHVRPVEWTREVQRSAIGQDLQYSFGAFLTVFQVYRNQAEQRINAVLAGKPDPLLSGDSLPAQSKPSEKPVVGVAVEDVAAYRTDIAQIAEDALRLKVGALFKGHRLSTLIGELLQAEGYRTVVSPPGADGGVDILAGKGPLGLDPPRLVVQVKSQDSAVDVTVLRELQGVMRQFNADHGLLVAWGGVTKPLTKEAQRHFFEIRIWDSSDVLRALQSNYERLSEEVRSDLPLKRIWILADEEAIQT